MALSLGLVLCSICFAVAGQVLLKSGMNKLTSILNSGTPILDVALQFVRTPPIVIGFLCYGFGAIFWLAVLARLDLSLAYPLLALMYVLIPLSARVFLNEEISQGRWVGIIIVIIGVAVLARFG